MLENLLFRAVYDEDADLGERRFSLDGQEYLRSDYDVTYCSSKN